MDTANTAPRTCSTRSCRGVAEIIALLCIRKINGTRNVIAAELKQNLSYARETLVKNMSNKDIYMIRRLKYGQFFKALVQRF